MTTKPPQRPIVKRSAGLMRSLGDGACIIGNLWDHEACVIWPNNSPDNPPEENGLFGKRKEMEPPKSASTHRAALWLPMWKEERGPTWLSPLFASLPRGGHHRVQQEVRLESQQGGPALPTELPSSMVKHLKMSVYFQHME